MAEPKILTPAVLTTHALPFTTNANSLMEQANRAEINDTDDFNLAVDHIKICTSQYNSAEEARKNLTGPLNNHVKWINAQFKPITDQFNAAKAAMKTKATKWQVAEDKRIAAAAAKARKEAEDQAIKDAEEAQAQGDDAKAEAIIESAADTPVDKAKAPTGRGGYTGASGSVRRTWVGECDNVKEMCAAICDGVLPETIIKEFSKLEMNNYAKEIMAEGVKNGIKITEHKDLSVK